LNVLRNMVNEMQIKNDLLSTTNKSHEQELDIIIEKMNEYYKLINSCNITSMRTESDVNGDLASCRTRIQKIIKDSKKLKEELSLEKEKNVASVFSSLLEAQGELIIENNLLQNDLIEQT